jgi:hypothetical protein
MPTPSPRIPALFLPVSNIGKQSWPESDIFPALRERGDPLHFPHFHSSGQILPGYLILAICGAFQERQFKSRCLFYVSNYVLSLRDDFMVSW